MKIKALVAVPLLAAFMLASFPVVSDAARNGGRHAAPAPEFSLTPEQQKKFEAIAQEFGPRFREIDDALFVKMEVLRALRNAAQPDVKAVSDTATEIVKLRAGRDDLRRQMGERIEKECGVKMPFRGCPGFGFGEMHGRGHGHMRHGGMYGGMRGFGPCDGGMPCGGPGALPPAHHDARFAE